MELLHHILGNKFKNSLLDRDTENVWQDIELRVDPDPFQTSCKISTINKKSRSNIPFNPKAPFKWLFMDTIPALSPKSLTKDTSFTNYFLIVYAYFIIPKPYGM